jgi:chemotaxis protein methyltransferase CheR
MTAALRSVDYRTLSAILARWTGINLHAKEVLMSGRLQPRLRALRLGGFAEYVDYLEQSGRSGPEAQRFINALTTNKTSFFRESHHFDFLVKRLFPELRERARSSGVKRARLWSAGCSRGAEPYTMAMLASEHLPAAQGWDVRILATDLDTDILAQAAAAVYDEEEVAPIPNALRMRCFARQGSSYKLQREIASLVTFAQANLIAEPFPVRGRFDAVFCRNVMIYFDRPTQDRVVAQLVKCLAPGGYLIIGHSESGLAQHLPRSGDTVGVYRPTTAGPAPATSLPRMAAVASRRPPPQLIAARVRPPIGDLPLKRIVLGEWFATGKPMLVSTLLGSCVAACLYDPVARVGGMNHFMLPKMLANDEHPARFGIHAMEVLVNEMMQLGAHRSRLRGMAFGAGAINPALGSTVAAENGAFVKQFLARERIPLVCERLGGVKPREVYLQTDTGQAFVRSVEADRVDSIKRAEVAAYVQNVPVPQEFNPDDALF